MVDAQMNLRRDIGKNLSEKRNELESIFNTCGDVEHHELWSFDIIGIEQLAHVAFHAICKYLLHADVLCFWMMKFIIDPVEMLRRLTQDNI